MMWPPPRTLCVLVPRESAARACVCVKKMVQLNTVLSARVGLQPDYPLRKKSKRESEFTRLDAGSSCLE